MSVYPTEVMIYGSVNMPEADGATVGGAVDLTRILSFCDLTGATLLDFVSSSASDTATKIQVAGRDGAGIIQTPAAATLNGQTKVAGTQSFGRLLYGVISGASATGPLANPTGTAAVGDVAAMAHTMTITAHTAQAGSANHTGITPPVIKLQSGDGASVTLGMIIRTTGGTGANQIRVACSTSGTGAGQYGTDIIAVNRDWGTLPDATTTYEVAPGFLFPILPNPVTSVVRPFAGVASDVVGGSSRTYYEKAFVLNTDGTTATTGMTLIKQTDPGGLYATATVELDIAPCTALNDTVTATNRQTVPGSGIGSFSAGAAPQTVTLAAQSAAANSAAQAQGFWMRLLIGAGAAPANTSFTLRPSGQTA
jgi:hypothetical protein